MTQDHPYRVSDEETPRFICVACHGTASVYEAGECSRCKVERLPLDNDQVKEDLRAYVGKRLQRADSRRRGFLFGGLSMLAMVLYVLLGLVGVVDLHQPGGWKQLPGVDPIVWIPLWVACLFGGTLLVELPARKRRVEVDAQTATISKLLEAIKVRVE